MSTLSESDGVQTLDVEAVRTQFPGLRTTVHDKPLVYFDTAASAQRPLAVVARSASQKKSSDKQTQGTRATSCTGTWASAVGITVVA